MVSTESMIAPKLFEKRQRKPEAGLTSRWRTPTDTDCVLPSCPPAAPFLQ
jgi:hypothetical protein